MCRIEVQPPAMPLKTVASACEGTAVTGLPGSTWVFRPLCFLWIAACALMTMVRWLPSVNTDHVRVFSYGMLTCMTTGLGVVPFMLRNSSTFAEKPLALANAAAGGMMLAASLSMLIESHEHCGFLDWQLFVGLFVGGFFIKVSESLHGSDDESEEEGLATLHCAFVERRHCRKALLIFVVMFCHSAAEGVAVGVSFSRQLEQQFGIFVSLLLAVHNVPEGLAVALVLVPRGVSTAKATVIAILTSIPQPFLAVAAFCFVDSFCWVLPFGLAFAAGAMVYVSIHELLMEAAESLGWPQTVIMTVISFAMMCGAIAMLHVNM